MLDRFKNLKIVKKLKDNVSPKLRWLMFSDKNSNKLSQEYIESISGVELKSMADAKKFEAMVREQLKAEFPNIEQMKSYELLVDAVMHNMRKKQLGKIDDLED